MRRAGGGGASGLSSADTASPRAPPRRKQTFKRRCAACVALAALGVAVIVMPRRTVDLKLDAAHLTARQWLGDAYWAARAAAAEAASVPRHIALRPAPMSDPAPLTPKPRVTRRPLSSRATSCDRSPCFAPTSK